ncbi:hypothetical protein TNCV_1419401 [Trichonephila clavipes]|nr:hypothetical protein TNCV_1419401 [Trichonephila clavipes]
MYMGAQKSNHAPLVPYKEKPETNDEIFYGEQYNWDSKVQGLILGSFFYGYIATQLPGGILAERIGAKWLYGGGTLVTAVFSLLTPLAASWGTATFITVRVLEGCDISSSEFHDRSVVSQNRKEPDLHDYLHGISTGERDRHASLRMVE